jgi:tetratricopeptide (TPR) repeat protein
MNRLDRLLALRESTPDDPEIHYMIALERAKEGDATQAIAGFDQCLRLDPEFHYAYYHKAVTLESMGKRSDAREVAEAGLERAQSDAGAAKAQAELSTLAESLKG